MNKPTIQELRRQLLPDGGKKHDEAFKFLRDPPESDELNPEQPPKYGSALLERALGILHRMGTERTGWRRVFRRWHYSDEPLRNDAANLVREVRFGMTMPVNTKLVGD